jgi:starvation-inducible DNA-binding protein
MRPLQRRRIQQKHAKNRDRGSLSDQILVEFCSAFSALDYRTDRRQNRMAPQPIGVGIQGEEMTTTEAIALDTKESKQLLTPTDLERKGVVEIAGELRQLLADVFVLYLKTKNFHWHMSGPHFRDYHLLLDEQADQLFEITDEIAERARKIGETTLHSISEISQYQRLKDNSEPFVSAHKMLSELHADNLALVKYMRATHETTSKHNDVATTSLLENWIDQAERRAWFLFETLRSH